MKKILLLFVFMAAFVAISVGQDTPTVPGLTVDTSAASSLVVAPENGLTAIQDVPQTPGELIPWLFNPTNGLFSILMLALMYASGYIPFLKKIDEKRLRAIVVGLIVGGGIVVWKAFDKELSFQMFFGMATTFVTTQLGYVFGLKPVGLVTPESKSKTTA